MDLAGRARSKADSDDKRYKAATAAAAVPEQKHTRAMDISGARAGIWFGGARFDKTFLCCLPCAGSAMFTPQRRLRLRLGPNHGPLCSSGRRAQWTRRQVANNGRSWPSAELIGLVIFAGKACRCCCCCCCRCRCCCSPYLAFALRGRSGRGINISLLEGQSRR